MLYCPLPHCPALYSIAVEYASYSQLHCPMLYCIALRCAALYYFPYHLAHNVEPPLTSLDRWTSWRESWPWEMQWPDWSRGYRISLSAYTPDTTQLSLRCCLTHWSCYIAVSPLYSFLDFLVLNSHHSASHSTFHLFHDVQSTMYCESHFPTPSRTFLPLPPTILFSYCAMHIINLNSYSVLHSSGTIWLLLSFWIRLHPWPYPSLSLSVHPP